MEQGGNTVATTYASSDQWKRTRDYLEEQSVGHIAGAFPAAQSAIAMGDPSNCKFQKKIQSLNFF